MSLATRCTHCGTIFKVVQDQLKVSEGWVRCGRCNEVFNALPALFDLDKDPPPPRVTAPAPPPAAPDEGASGPESQPPSDWAPTQPTALPEPMPPAEAATPQAPATAFESPVASTRPLTEADLALEPAPLESATDFELDTAIAVDDNTPLEDVLAAVAPRSAQQPVQPQAPTQAPTAENPYPGLHVSSTPRPWLDEPPEDLPTTDEEDALDSRYLMPTARERKAPRRPDDGPEFADAQFPIDAMEDAQDDWASDFGPSALEPDAALAMPTRPGALGEVASPPATHGLRATLATPSGALTTPPSSGPGASDDLDNPVSQPPAVPDDFRPEQAIEPPSLRKGRPGTRGRDPAQQAPEFVKRAQRKAFWRHPATRAMLSLVLLSLVLGLGLQLMHQFRDLLAAYNPETRPLLVQWCEAVGCKLAPPLRLEDLQVESATLVRATSEGADSYRLAVVVHNKSTVDLAWPHVDLTLTDENGAVIARRVFTPADAQWLDTADPKADVPAGSPKTVSPSASTPTAAPSQRSTTLQWRLRAPDLHPANYTAELFYP